MDGGPLVAFELTSRIRSLSAATRPLTSASDRWVPMPARRSSRALRNAMVGGVTEIFSRVTSFLTHHSSSDGPSISARGFPVPGRLSNSPRSRASRIWDSIQDSQLTSPGFRAVIAPA